jgi:nucleolar protein 15
MAAVKSKKDTKAPVKKTTSVKKAAAEKSSTEIDAGSKRKRVSFPKDSAEPASKKKAAAKAELESSDEEEEDELKQEVAEEEEELTEEQEEAFRKEILGDIASSEGEDSSDEENDAIEGNKDIIALDEKKLEESMSETKKTFDKKTKASKVNSFLLHLSELY